MKTPLTWNLKDLTGNHFDSGDSALRAVNIERGLTNPDLFFHLWRCGAIIHSRTLPETDVYIKHDRTHENLKVTLVVTMYKEIKHYVLSKLLRNLAVLPVIRISKE